MSGAPRVSIVTATFNRSNILRYSIESVLAQTFRDWELIVVGDACTDDTEDVVRSFGDPRIRFVNLAVNSGEQATPNNEGVRLGRGESIAFLNHDDLWTPDHLATCLEAIEDADLVSTVTIAVERDGTPRLEGVCPRGVYEPWIAIRASSWLLRRTLAEEVGPWRPARELFAVPSQDWLYRAWRQKRRLRSVARPTVIAVMSGGVKGSYSNRVADQSASWAKRLREEPDLIARVMTEIACRVTAETQDLGVSRHFVRAAKAIIRRLAMTLGVHPWAVRNALLFRRRGGYLNRLRQTRGLGPLPS